LPGGGAGMYDYYDDECRCRRWLLIINHHQHDHRRPAAVATTNAAALSCSSAHQFKDLEVSRSVPTVEGRFVHLY